jgi:cysteine-rich repeat protein
MRVTVGRVAAVVMLTACMIVAAAGSAGATGYPKGPDPTAASLLGTGPFATASVTVPSSVSGFGGGVIHYPTDTSEGTFGAVAFAPGFLGSSANYGWLGPRLASHGFVVLLMNTNAPLDNAASRGQQLLAALSYLISSSPVAGRIDPSRLAVAGHSMGGGGTLEAANVTPWLRAAIAAQPFNANWSNNWNGIVSPTLIIGSDGDTTAPVATYAIPFYQALPSTTERAYIELRNALHSESTQGNDTQGMYMIVWLKVFVDEDARYYQFLCPNPGPSDTIRDFRTAVTCPAVAQCGDGVVDDDEDCDDGDLVDGDGCSASCVVEPGWSCTGEPSTCEPICGDGLVVGDEACDAGVLNGDPSGCCTASCAYRPAGEECRAAAGDCDVAEQCTGTAAECPADAFASASTVCRPAASECDVAEHCTGDAVACPADTGLPDTDGDTVCDELDNCVAIANATQADGDGDGLGDACDPCTNLGPAVASKASVTLSKLLAPAGDEKVSFTSLFTAVPGAADIDPLVDGVRFLIADASGALPIDVTIPGGAYVAADKAGWKVNGAATAWTYKNAGSVVPAIGGITTVQIKRFPAKPGTLQVKVLGKKGSYAVAALPLVGTIVLDPPVAASGRCGEAWFPNTAPLKPSCVATGGGKTVKCR